MAQLKINGSTVHYTDHGKGQVLVCVHGWMHSGKGFKNLAVLLSKNYRVICLDLPNFGDSQPDARVYSADDYAEVLAQFVTKLRLKTYTLVGHSMGGQIVIKAVSEQVVKPEKLVLIASAGVPDTRRVYRIFTKCMQLFSRSEHRKIVDKTLDINILDYAASITTPALLIYGSKDISTPLAMGKKLATAITGSKLEIIDDENHWPHQTSAEKVAKIIEKFLTAA